MSTSTNAQVPQPPKGNPAGDRHKLRRLRIVVWFSVLLLVSLAIIGISAFL